MTQAPARGALTISKPQILGYFLEALNKMGVGHLRKVPPRNQPISGDGGLLVGSADMIWLLALKCMYVFGDYHLILQQSDVESKGRNVGGFINCIIAALKAHNVKVTN
jgi:hypothetical protein